MDDLYLGARAVRREELDDSRSPSLEPSSSPNPSSAEARFLVQLKQSYDIDGTADMSGGHDEKNTYTVTADPPGGGDEGIEEYEFRLFAGPKAGAPAGADHTAAQRIALRSPTPTHRDPGFVVPRRPEGYYFTGPLSQEDSERFRLAAVSGEDIVKGLQRKWRGAELPWRVTVVQSERVVMPGRVTAVEGEGAGPGSCGKRRRVGKKRRIAVRKKVRARDAGKAAELLSRVEKERAEREKRTRKNRERKVKKRRKEKEKKSQEGQDV